MQNAENGVIKPDDEQAQPMILRKRIGSTMYEVSIRFSETSKETLEDKILRLMGREVNKSA